MSDKSLLEAISKSNDVTALMQAAQWHESVAEDSPWWDKDTNKKDKARDKERHQKIAAAIYKRIEELDNKGDVSWL